MILVDANIFMYAAGAPHPHKEPSQDYLRRMVLGEVEGSTDVEVLQEILHRFRAIGRWALGRQIYDETRRIVATIHSLSAEIMDEARLLMDAYPALIARDAIHAAVCLQTACSAICSYDRDFDAIKGVVRIEP